MLKILIFKLLALSVFLFLSVELDANDNTHYQNPEGIIELFKSGSVAEIYNQFDTTMQNKLSPPRLEPIWSQMLRNYGKYNRIGSKDTIFSEKSIVINTDIIFKNGIMNMMLSWDSKSKKINDFYLTEVKKEKVTLNNKLPSYIDTTKFKTIDLKIEAKFPLSAKLTIPKYNNENNKTVFILNPGSGKQNKDLKVGPNKVFKNLAWGLSSIGYSVLRYDKITYKYFSKLEKSNPNYTINDEFIEPIESVIQFVKSFDKLNNYKLILIGYDEAASMITELMDLSC
jgi:hypothetical protein